MKNNRRIIVSIIYVFLGAVLFGLGFAEIVDAFWSGMGSALIAIGVVRAIQFLRFRKDASYREKMEVEMKDERNMFIRNKAWAWSGYLFILVAAVLTIVFKILDQDLLSMSAAFSVCLVLVFYWISYMVLNRKY